MRWIKPQLMMPIPFKTDETPTATSAVWSQSILGFVKIELLEFEKFKIHLTVFVTYF